MVAKIILTGGGTAGHVTPNIALIPELEKENLIFIILAQRQGLKESLL